jgi:hypothetical protein
MSADLFAVFGTPDEVPSKSELEERWVVPQGAPTSPTIAHQVQQLKPRNLDVLFDADEVEPEAEAEDDFGDFEDVEAGNEQRAEPRSAQRHTPVVTSVAPISQQVDLLDLDNSIAPVQDRHPISSLETTNDANATSETDDWGEFEDSPLETQLAPRSWEPSPVVHVPLRSTPRSPAPDVSSSKDDNWDEFDDWTAEPPPTQDLPPATSSTQPTNTDHPTEPRPTNIPPPSILLQILPEIYQSLHSEIQSQSPSLSTDPDSDPSPLATTILLIYNVSARLLAGRTLRLTRSSHLSQSQLIGPSTPGSRSGGMKLASLSRLTIQHTTQTAALVCDAWASHAHAFTSIVGRWMRLDGNLKVVAGPAGVMSAREECVLCGVRREERIAGVDFESMDVFGEYWVEGWGHADCKWWWYDFREMLAQR